MKKKTKKNKFAVDDEDNTEDFDEKFEYELVHADPSGKAQQQKKKKKKKTTRRKKKNNDFPDDVPSGESVASCVHPIDNKRRLWFVSDFPHLVKSMKQRVIKSEELQVKKKSVQ